MEFPRKQFKKLAIESGRSDEFINEALSYADRINYNSAPVIFSLVHFSIASECSHRHLLEIIKNREKNYKNYSFKKKLGGTRPVDSPFPVLKKAQRYLYNKVLIDQDISSHAYAYVHSKSIVDNAAVHINQDYIRTFDINNFFGSITYETILKVFKDIGYASNLAIDLAKICSIPKDGKEFLPQGSPVSPILSNIIMKPFDDRMSNFAVQNDLKYSRYADDFTFSGNLDRLPKISFISKVLSDFNMTLNHKKTRTYGPKSNKRIVTGILVSDTLRLLPAYKDEIKQHLYYINKFGVDNHLKFLEKKNGYSKSFCKEFLYGKILYLNMVEPDLGKSLLLKYNSIDWGIK